MATAVQSPEALSRPAPARRTTVPAQPKLRDSCHACAASKVKCNKEKPTCSRCAKRGLNCEYFVTKRTGRKRDSRTNEQKHAAHLSISTTSSEPLTITTTPNLIQPSPRPPPICYPDILPNLLSPTEPSLSTGLTSEFDDFFASPISFPGLESSGAEILIQPQNDMRCVTTGMLESGIHAPLLAPDDGFSILDETANEMPNFSKPQSPPNSRASTIISEAQSLPVFPTDLPCCCLICALGLLKQLFPNAATACPRSNKQGFEQCAQLLTIQAVIAENEKTIEKISSMLQCSCSQDGYLLTIMALIVFKVLGWYAAAAREAPVTDDGQHSPNAAHDGHRRTSHSPCHEQVLQSPTVVGSYCIDGEDQGRMTAQLVLSELHRVQRFVNQLSQRLKTHTMRGGPVRSPTSPTDTTFQNAFPDKESLLPFSASMFDQLEADLRKRLRSLSLEIVDMLRRG